MKAELIDGYYFVTSDNNSLLGEKDEEIMRFSKEEFESFIDNFVLARELNKSIDVEQVGYLGNNVKPKTVLIKPTFAKW